MVDELTRLLVKSYEPYLVTVPDDEPPYEDTTVKSVSPDGSGWTITSEAGWSLFIPALPVLNYSTVLREPIEPHVGDRIRFYGKGYGFGVEGVQIRDQVVFYHDQEQRELRRQVMLATMDAEKAKRFIFQKADLDNEYAALPEFFKDRIDRFRSENPDFRADSEGYEMFACIEAVKIALHLQPTLPDSVTDADIVAAVQGFKDLPWDEQKPVVSDAHSGNTFGGACALAVQYLRKLTGVNMDAKV